jgi:hypothetical protein
MEAHLNEALSLLHELTREADNEIGAITNLILLHLSGHSDHLGGRVVNLNLSDNCGGIGKIKEYTTKNSEDLCDKCGHEKKLHGKDGCSVISDWSNEQCTCGQGNKNE